MMPWVPSTPGFDPPHASGAINITDEDDKDGFTSAKRNRSSNIVASDDKTSYDDNASICTPISKNYEDKDDDVSSRPLKRVRKLNDITIDLNKSGNSSCEDEEDDDDGGDNSLKDFNNDSSEFESESESRSREADSYDELEPENALNEYKASLDKIRRKKELKLKWELEGDMLADFRKDPELRVRAVSALYRHQTEDEKVGKVTIYYNERGFSQFDALRGSNVAEFLTDGDPNCDLNKTVEELERYDAKGVELCMTLAAKYSKQLFQIYQNKEDPYFLP